MNRELTPEERHERALGRMRDYNLDWLKRIAEKNKAYRHMRETVEEVEQQAEWDRQRQEADDE